MTKILVVILTLSAAYVINIQNEEESSNMEAGLKELTPELKRISALPDKEKVVFEGLGRGFVDIIKVEVTFAREESSRKMRIEKVEVVKHNEITSYWKEVPEKIISRVLETQSTDIDAVSGATHSSEGLLEAIQNAKEKIH